MKIAALEAHQVAILRTFNTPTAALEIDDATGTIRNVAIASVGPAEGHGFKLDHRSLTQLAEAINRRGGSVPTRFKHPKMNQTAAGVAFDDALASIVGRVTNPRIVDNVLRGDLIIEDFASHSPLGNMRSFVIGLARSMPTAVGLSAVFEYDTTSDGAAVPTARIHDCLAVDLVDRPAANANGLLSTLKGAPIMDPKLLEMLIALGLDPNSNAEQAKSFVGGLPAEKQEELRKQFPDFFATAAATMHAMPAGNDIAALETRRCTQIAQLGQVYRIPDFADRHIAAGTDQATFVQLARREMAVRFADPGAGRITVGTDARVAALSVALPQAVAAAMGATIRKPHELAHQYAGLSVLDIGRQWLQEIGADPRGMTKGSIARVLVNRGAMREKFGGRVAMLAHTTSDFSHILGSSVGVALRNGYEEAPATWQLWAKRGNAPDFTEQERANLSALPTPPQVLEHDEYTNVALSDTGEVFTLAKYGEIVSITWEALVNDRLGAFAKMVGRLGAACKRLEDDIAYVPLTTGSNGQTMSEDNVALFHADHSNLASGGGNVGAPTVGLLSKARAAMARQTGLADEILNITPRTLLVPVTLVTEAEVLVASTVDPTTGTTNDKANSAFVRNLQVVGEPRLDADSTTSWYLAADPANVDTVEVCFLEGHETPYTEEQEGFRVDGTAWKCRHVVAARAIDYRGLYKNPGA